MNWTKIWLDLFGTTTLWGLDMGFWVAMAAVLLIVVLMNVVFWGMKPQQPESGKEQQPEYKNSTAGMMRGSAVFHFSCGYSASGSGRSRTPAS